MKTFKGKDSDTLGTTFFSKKTVNAANGMFFQMKAQGFAGDFGGFSGFCSVGEETVHLDGHFMKEELLALAMVLEEKAVK